MEPEPNLTLTVNNTGSTFFPPKEEQPGWMLSPLDLAIVGLYLVGSLGFGLWWGWRRRGGAEEYFLAGRTSSWPLVGLSLFASNISSTTLIGLAGDAYAHGIAVYNYEWMAAPVVVMLAVFMVPGLVRSRVYTTPELLHSMYNGCARYYFSAITVVLSVVVETAGTLYAGGVVVGVLAPGWPLWQVMAVLAGVAGLYTVTGGLAAVMITDAMQAVLLGAGSIAITVCAVQQAGGWSAVLAAQPPGHMSLIRPLDDPSVPWPGLLGVLLLGIFFFGTNQFMMQRVLSAGSICEGQWGLLLAGVLKLPVLFIMVLPGLAAKALYPDLARPDMVYPTLMLDLLPRGVVGLVLAGFLAALMSQLDSTLNAVATLVTMDWVRVFWPNLTPRNLRLAGQGVTVVVVVAAVCWAPQIQNYPSLYQYLQQILAYTVSPVLTVYIIGFFWRGATPLAASVTLVVGTLLGVTLFLLNVIFKLIHIHFLYIPPILLAFSGLVLVLASLIDSGTAREDRIVLWSIESFTEETEELKTKPLWQNYRLHCLLLLFTTCVIVGLFW